MSPESKNRKIRRFIYVYFAGQLAIIVAMIITLKINIWLFAGMVAGILHVPLAITINAVTEAVGLSKNGFE